jgi:hypothetical protein
MDRVKFYDTPPMEALMALYASDSLLYREVGPVSLREPGDPLLLPGHMYTAQINAASNLLSIREGEGPWQQATLHTYLIWMYNKHMAGAVRPKDHYDKVFTELLLTHKGWQSEHKVARLWLENGWGLMEDWDTNRRDYPHGYCGPGCQSYYSDPRYTQA